MKEYLDKKTLLDYLDARVKIGECVVNDDLLDAKTRDMNRVVVLDRKNLVATVKSMETEDPYEKIVDRIEELISYYKNWKNWLGYGSSNFVSGQIFAYQELLDFIKKLSEEKEDDDK